MTGGRITFPRTAADYPDRDLDCQMASEGAFQELVAGIVKAGWGEEEALDALGELVRNHRLAMEANRETGAAIEAARQGKRIS